MSELTLDTFLAIRNGIAAVGCHYERPTLNASYISRIGAD